MNSPLHVTGTTFPFTERFTGCGWNCRSLYACEELHTIHHAERLSAQLDFVALFETVETMERKATLEHHLQAEHAYYSSFTDQYKGGVGLVIKHSFLQNFTHHEWQVIATGRVGRLALSGNKGTLHIYVVYFYPIATNKKLSVLKSWVRSWI
jgi:hypothetical protein